MSDGALTPEELTQLRRLLSDPLAFPMAFKSWVTAWVEANPPSTPISQVPGFAQFTAFFDSKGNADSTSAITLGDCTNPGAQIGPTLTGLPDGKYVLLYGALASVSVAGNIAAMNVSVNGVPKGAVPTSGDAEARGTSFYSVATGSIVTLSNKGNNSLKGVYAVDNAAVSGFFGSRWLVAHKFSNL